MKKLYEVKEKLIDELESYADKGISGSSVEAIDKLAHAAKNVGKIIEMCEDEGGYSERDGMYRGGSYRRGGRSYDGGSYRRDSMGRYSRTGEDDETGKIQGLKEEVRQIMTKLEQM